MSPETKELYNKISEVELTMTKAMGEINSNIKELSVTVKAATEQLRDANKEIGEIKLTAADAKQRADGAHKRNDSTDEKLKPLVEANLIERVKKLEDNNRWVVVTVGAILLGAILRLVVL